MALPTCLGERPPGVRANVGLGGEQHVHQREVSTLARAGKGRIMKVVHIGPCSKQTLSNVSVAVLTRLHQGLLAVPVIGRRTCAEETLDNGEVAVTAGDKEGPAFLGTDVCTSGEQVRDNGGVAAPDRCKQRGATVRVGVRSRSQQSVHDRKLAVAAGCTQGAAARGIRVRPGIQQALDDGQVAVGARQVERADVRLLEVHGQDGDALSRRTASVLLHKLACVLQARVDVGPCRQQALHHGQVAVPARAEQRRVFACAHVHAQREQPLHDGQVAKRARAGQRGLAVRVHVAGAGDKDPHKHPKMDGHLWVPVDDEHCWVYNWSCATEEAFPPGYPEFWESFMGRGKDDLIPGTYRLKRNDSNDYMIDRDLQRKTTYSGIKGINTQDYALQERMDGGKIVDRSREFLGSTDKAIVTSRRQLLEGTRKVEAGERP